MFESSSRRSDVGNWWTLGLGIAIGAALAAMFDPRQGAGRRAKARDRSAATVRDLVEQVRRRSLDLQQRLRGALIEARHGVSEQYVPDELLAERLRAQIGRPVSHPRLIEVDVHDGHVMLTGAVLEDEVPGLIARLSKVRGVKDVNSRLDVFASEDEIARYAGRHGAKKVEEEPVPPFTH